MVRQRINFPKILGSITTQKGVPNKEFSQRPFRYGHQWKTMFTCQNQTLRNATGCPLACRVRVPMLQYLSERSGYKSHHRTATGCHRIQWARSNFARSLTKIGLCLTMQHQYNRRGTVKPLHTCQNSGVRMSPQLGG